MKQYETSSDICDKTRECIYANSLDETKAVNVQLRELYDRFNCAIADVLPGLY
jgi:hypothetical protein